MKVAVMGAGAVGCFYGAMLARAGYHVTLIGRRQHVAAVCERGLILEMGAPPTPWRLTQRPIPRASPTPM
jgi:2-dehydropantoate 2-reductase